MSFLKRVVPLKAEMHLQIENMNVVEGESFKGLASLESKEKFKVENVRLELRVNECWRETRHRSGKHGGSYTTTVTNTLYSRDVPISEPFETESGDKRDFPFEVAMPIHYPTRLNSWISYSLKAVANVKGRPDVTKEVNPNISPSGV